MLRITDTDNMRMPSAKPHRLRLNTNDAKWKWRLGQKQAAAWLRHALASPNHLSAPTSSRLHNGPAMRFKILMTSPINPLRATENKYSDTKLHAKDETPS